LLAEKFKDSTIPTTGISGFVRRSIAEKIRELNFKYGSNIKVYGVSRNSSLLNHLENLSQFISLPKATEHSELSWFGYPITIKDSRVSRNELMKFLVQKKDWNQTIICRQPLEATLV
jgi:hypothetical protein